MAADRSSATHASSFSSSPEHINAFVSGLEHSEDEIRARIDQMGMPADAKALLHGFSKATLTVGKAALKIGRKILDVLLSMLREFPHLSFGVLFGLLVGALLGAIPLIGTVLAPIATPLALLFGVSLAFPHELRNGDLGERIAAVLRQFESLGS